MATPRSLVSFTTASEEHAVFIFTAEVDKYIFILLIQRDSSRRILPTRLLNFQLRNTKI
jgi:hypothetical protein